MNDAPDLLILGGGPAGYVGAIRAAQLGLRVQLVERDQLGGTCLNRGCIPTKAMYQSAELARLVQDSARFGVRCAAQGIDYAVMAARRDGVVAKLRAGVEFLMRKNRIAVTRGTAEFLAPHRVRIRENGQTMQSEKILICTGSQNAVPPIPGILGRNVLDSTALLSLTQPPESLAVIGGGVIGCELAGVLSALGTKVTLIEMLPAILKGVDEDCAAEAARSLEEDGVGILTDARVSHIDEDEAGNKLVHVEQNGCTRVVAARAVLLAVGRRADTQGLGLEAAGVLTRRGFVLVNDSMESSMPGVYAAGDVTGKLMLAHAASAQCVAAVESMLGMGSRVCAEAIPKVVFLNPEIASVGLTEQECAQRGVRTLVGVSHLLANGKALAQGTTEGFVKVLAGAENHEILGVHMRGSGASELITLGAAMIQGEALLEDVGETVYPHPSVSEAVRDACLNALGRMA